MTKLVIQILKTRDKKQHIIGNALEISLQFILFSDKILEVIHCLQILFHF